MRKTGLVIVALIVANLIALGVYDLGAQLGWWAEAVTFSEWMNTMGFRYPIIPIFFALVAGLSIGHFWWPLSQPKIDPERAAYKITSHVAQVWMSSSKMLDAGALEKKVLELIEESKR